MRTIWMSPAVALCLICRPAGGAAQLRPLEPLDWTAWQSARALMYSAGVAAYADQRVGLAGVRGNLIELGDVRVQVRTGRVVIEVAGTPQRFLRDESYIEAPTGGARAMNAERSRHDAGDYRVGTTILLGGSRAAEFETLRFGTRLPTTDNRVGLDRDQTDFFALLGVHRSLGRLHAGVEAGISINGTRRVEYEQSDVLAYDVTIRYESSRMTPMLQLVGHSDLRSERTRGNEDLAELRASIRSAGARWLQVGLIVGLTEFSPRVGGSIGFGVR